MIKLYISPCNEKNQHEIGEKLARYAFFNVYKSTARLSYRENGKPCFENEEKSFVGISHSKGYCIAAVSDKEIGVDIEFIEDKPNLTALARRYFTVNEAQYVSRRPCERFYEIWCKKESFMKYTGEGFSRPMSSFSVLDGKLTYSFFTYDGYAVSVCSEEKYEGFPVLTELTSP